MNPLEHDEELSYIRLSFEKRTIHIPISSLDLFNLLGLLPAAKGNISLARERGDLRRKQGNAAAMVVESRVLEGSVSLTPYKTISAEWILATYCWMVTIVDEVDSKQALFT